MEVREAMSQMVLTIGPGHTLRQAAVQMARRNVGAAVVVDPDGEGPGVLPQRDILHAIADGENVDDETVGAHQSSKLVVATPDWSLEQAAMAMVKGGFRHLVVVDGGEPAGVVSVRDSIRC